MKRRTFFRGLLGGLGLVAAAPVVAADNRTALLQESPVAGFQFHDGEFIWSSLGVGKKLKLVREAGNIHDPNAVAVHLGESQLGYVPRAENTAVAQILDRGERLEASITQLTVDENPWKRIRIGISLV